MEMVPALAEDAPEEQMGLSSPRSLLTDESTQEHQRSPMAFFKESKTKRS